MTNETTPGALGSNAELGDATKAHPPIAFWANLLISHIWGAACYLHPGWVAGTAWALFLALAGLILYEPQITAYLERRAGNESA